MSLSLFFFPSLAHTHTLSFTHTWKSSSHTHTYTQCFTLSSPHGERFVQQQLSEQLNWDSALKVFQVIWLRCLPKAPGNGSFIFSWLESSSSPRQVNHQPCRSPMRAGGEERAGRWYSCGSGSCLCRRRRPGCSNQCAVEGSKMAGWVVVCGYVCL